MNYASFFHRQRWRCYLWVTVFWVGGCSLPGALPNTESGASQSAMAAESISLTDKRWTAISLHGVDSQRLGVDSQPWVSLQETDEGFRLRGHTGCNSFSARAMLDEDKLTLDGALASRRYCAETADVEQAFLAAADKVVFSDQGGSRWVWYDQERTQLVVFAADDDSPAE